MSKLNFNAKVEEVVNGKNNEEKTPSYAPGNIDEFKNKNGIDSFDVLRGSRHIGFEDENGDPRKFNQDNPGLFVNFKNGLSVGRVQKNSFGHPINIVKYNQKFGHGLSGSVGLVNGYDSKKELGLGVKTPVVPFAALNYKVGTNKFSAIPNPGGLVIAYGRTF